MCRLLLFAAFAAGCYVKPAATNNPLQSREGVRVRLLGQDCADHVGADGDPVSRELALQLQVQNPTPEPVEFVPEAVHLAVGGDASASNGEGQARQVGPGQSATFVVRFLHHSVCNREFTLAFRDAFKLAGKPMALADLRFTPY